MEEELLTYALKEVAEKYGEAIKNTYSTEEFDATVVVPTTPFPRVKLADLYEALEKEYGYKGAGS